MDDETDLPDLGELDLDDSAEDFWKMDNVSLYTNIFIKKKRPNCGLNRMSQVWNMTWIGIQMKI